MANTAMEFVNEVFGALTGFIIDGKVFFLGKQVAMLLGYANPNEAVQDHVWEEDKKALKYKANSDLLLAKIWKGNDFMDKVMITREGVLSLIFESKMPRAHEFRSWIFGTVIPSLMENGGYIVGQEDLESEEREALLEEIRTLRMKILKRDQKIEALHMNCDALQYDLGREKVLARGLQIQLEDLRERCRDYGI